MRKWLLSGAVFLSLFVGVPGNQGQDIPFDSARLYDVAMELYHQGKYPESIDAFSKLMKTFPTSRSVPYAVYMIGQSYLWMGKPDEAIQHFNFYLRQYPDGDRVNEAEKAIQMAREKGKQKMEPAPTPAMQARRPGVSSSLTKKAKRRICAQIFYLDSETWEDVDRQFKDLKKAGVNTLIVRVFQTKGDRPFKFATPRCSEGVYFKTDNAPVVDDVLGRLADISHRNELDLFAWITTQYSNFNSDGDVEHRIHSYNFETKRIEPARGLTVFHPDVVRRFEEIFRDLGRFPIDGILFQDDLILRHNEDFSPEAQKAFLKEFRFFPHPDLFYVDPYRSETGKYYVRSYTHQFWAWADWKNRWLMNVAQQLMTAARSSNPKLEFGINLYYETALSSTNSLARFSQTLGRTQEKNFDYYAIMAYHRQTMRELNLDFQKTIDLMTEVAQRVLRSVGDPFRVMMKVQVLDWKGYQLLPPKEIDDILTRLLTQGDFSLAFVPYVDPFPLQPFKGKWIEGSKANHSPNP
jgi:tetratricopeptide (TPR) repeat protein